MTIDRATEARVASFFAGIGGLDLGLERAGLGRTVYACQASSAVLGDPTGYADHALRVLAARFPGAALDPRSIEDVRLTPGQYDIIAGGFPCQDVSTAGKGAGLAGARSGLWYAMLARVAECLPRCVVAENVAALQSRGLDDVAEGLRELGYQLWGSVIWAADLGAPHRRARIFLVAVREPVRSGGIDRHGGRWTLLDRRGMRVERWRDTQAEAAAWPTPCARDWRGTGPSALERHSPSLPDIVGGSLNPTWVESLMGFPVGWTDPGAEPAPTPSWPMPQGPDQHPWEPPRTAAPRTVPHRGQRIATLGNAVVPACGEVAGHWALDLLTGAAREAQCNLW
jgi:hypothetical protein